ncbi:hypothetical protein SCB49_13155 [unidentified eubacterium SCB49]|nr:hypothetical protein SCB49_13155 [unidentified eubacterium SCB49]
MIGVLVSCKTSEIDKTSNAVHTIDSWLVAPSFLIDCTMAYPVASNELNQLSTSNLLGTGNTANQINLLGRGDFLRVSENRVEANISYYGTQRFGTATAGNTGILIDNELKDYSYTFNERKGSTEIIFSASHKQEHYKFNITIYKNRHCNIEVTSNKRSFIRYDGNIEAFTIE